MFQWMSPLLLLGPQWDSLSFANVFGRSLCVPLGVQWDLEAFQDDIVVYHRLPNHIRQKPLLPWRDSCSTRVYHQQSDFDKNCWFWSLGMCVLSTIRHSKKRIPFRILLLNCPSKNHRRGTLKNVGHRKPKSLIICRTLVTFQQQDPEGNAFFGMTNRGKNTHS
jgi:hypothetical protein